jgi:hypothetical protein
MKAKKVTKQRRRTLARKAAQKEDRKKELALRQEHMHRHRAAFGRSSATTLTAVAAGLSLLAGHRRQIEGYEYDE